MVLPPLPTAPSLKRSSPVPEPKRSALGTNPLDKGIFTKTAPPDNQAPKLPEPQPQGEALKLSNIQEYGFLNPEQLDREAVTLRLPNQINDWLDELLKQGKRKHGRKIPKELWVQAALELLQAAPIDWAAIATEDDLREALKKLLSTFQKLDY